MTAVAPAWPAGTERGRRRGILLRPAAGIAGWCCSTPKPRRCSRSVRPGCAAIGPWASRRRTALHWRALTRVTEPLEAAVAALHHGDDVRFRRAGRHAVAVVLQHCTDTGRSWWGWTPWEWARLRGGSAREFVAAQSLPTDSTVRPLWWPWRICSAGSPTSITWACSDRLHLACLIFGEPAVDEAMCRAEQVLDRWGYRMRKAREAGCGASSQVCCSTAVPGSRS